MAHPMPDSKLAIRVYRAEKRRLERAGALKFGVFPFWADDVSQAVLFCNDERMPVVIVAWQEDV